jgi:hypothetical protein
MERVAAIETDPATPRAGERFAPGARFSSDFLMFLPFPGDEKERLAAHIEPRDEGSALRPGDEIDEFHRKVVFHMSVLLLRFEPAIRYVVYYITIV